MRHRINTVKLNRTSSHRKAMFRNMVTSLFKHDRIQTTDAKAKELRRWADHLITLAKRGDLHARRQALSIVREKAIVHKLFAEAAERYGSAAGGYTRIVKIGRRPGDAAFVSMIELLGQKGEKPKKKVKKTIETESQPAKATDLEDGEIETNTDETAVAEESATPTKIDEQVEAVAESKESKALSEESSGEDNETNDAVVKEKED